MSKVLSLCAIAKVRGLDKLRGGRGSQTQGSIWQPGDLSAEIQEFVTLL